MIDLSQTGSKFKWMRNRYKSKEVHTNVVLGDSISGSSDFSGDIGLRRSRRCRLYNCSSVLLGVRRPVRNFADCRARRNKPYVI